MKIPCAPYLQQAAAWPVKGRHILAHYDQNSLIVYQAYRPSIGTYAAQHGHFGGDFSFSRMSWCKPNFLWMMYRSGWGRKENQEITLAIRLKRDFFDSLLEQAVYSQFDPAIYPDEAAWKQAVNASDVRLQWDPDHSPAGAALERRALQLGLRGRTLAAYACEATLEIEDISAFVAEQRNHVNQLERLLTPIEQVYLPDKPGPTQRLGLDTP